MADNTFVNIGGHKVSAGIKYSTSEVRTGDVWTDGKPIYRKVISTTITSYSDNGNRRSFSYSENLDIDTLVSVNGYSKPQNGSDGNIVLMRALGSNISTGTLSVNATSDVVNNGGLLGVSIYMGTAYSSTKVDICVIAEYTKTTD